MRFYCFILILFLPLFNLLAQQDDTLRFSSEQVDLIQNQGSSGIQSLFKESDIQIYDLTLVENFVTKVAYSLLVDAATENIDLDLVPETILAFTELAISENIEISYVVEYVSAGLIKGAIKSTLINDINPYDLTKSVAERIAFNVIGFGINSGIGTDKISAAAASGSLAGAIETSREIDINTNKSTAASSSGLVAGAIYSTANKNINPIDSLIAISSGITEGTIEATVTLNLELIMQIKASAQAAAQEAHYISKQNNVDAEQIIDALTYGLSQPIKKILSGKGTNIRIFIIPVDIDTAEELVKAVSSAIFLGIKSGGYLPIPLIPTPYIDDLSVRQVSPYSP